MTPRCDYRCTVCGTVVERQVGDDAPCGCGGHVRRVWALGGVSIPDAAAGGRRFR